MAFSRKLLLALSVSVAFSGPAFAQIKVGVNGPMTGPYAVFGDQMKRGAEYAAKDINSRGGIQGQQIELIVGDDACDPKQAVAVANKAATAGAKAVIGHYCSGSSIPASDVYNENGIVQISPASTNPKFTDDAASKGWVNVFRTVGRDDKQGVTASEFIAKNFKDKKIAILHDKSAYGKGLADATKSEINKKGMKEALYEAYNPGEKDYSAIISRLKSLGADVVYIGGYHTEVGLMLRQARDQGLKAQFMSGDAMATDELPAIAGPAIEGFLYTFGKDPRGLPSAKPVVEALNKAGIDPEGYTLYTVAAFQVYEKATKDAASTDVKKVAAAIHGKSFDTVLGQLTFDNKGDITNPNYVVYEFKNGKAAEKTM